MPGTVTIAAFVFGAVLLLLALVGGGFKLFGAEFSGRAGRPARIMAGLLGVVLIYIGLVNPFDKGGVADANAANQHNGATLSSIKDSATLTREHAQTEGQQLPRDLSGTWVGTVALLEDRNTPVTLVRLVVTSKGEANLYQSYAKDAASTDSKPLTMIAGRLSVDSGLYFVYVAPNGVPVHISGGSIEFPAENKIRLEGLITLIDPAKRDLPASQRSFKAPAIITLEREN